MQSTDCTFAGFKKRMHIMEYTPSEFEGKWQKMWAEQELFKASESSDQPKFYVLDMFPYPSGAGLHVGHPLGYIASDIVSRYKRHRGFMVLHPMGYDSFGLPAEQYAIKTGRHPADTTRENVARYREQLDALGFSFDWSREVQTSDPSFYRWTQWIFLKLFDSWYDSDLDKARPIQELVEWLEEKGSKGLSAAGGTEEEIGPEQWSGMSEEERSDFLQHFRLAYRSDAFVNWCPELGTVLANDEVKDGFSERGGHPVERKKMTQWSLRITAYAERLLNELDTIAWSESLKESQRHWIGRSEGARLRFSVQQSEDTIDVFSTRPDTLYGATFLVLAPEHEGVSQWTTEECKEPVDAYRKEAARRSERERMSETKRVSGVFTGSYALHPLTEEPIPIWVADYVLAGYGSGAVMAVPGHDARDHAFAQKFGLPIVEVVAGGDVQKEAFESKEGSLVNSPLIDGLSVEKGKKKMLDILEAEGLGQREVQYKLRDAAFGRQRYWGEPIPIYYDQGIPKPVRDEHLPLELPEVSSFLPTEDGDPPLGNAQHWSYLPEKGLVPNGEGHPIECTTMPGWAGSSWYWLRYMSPNAQNGFTEPQAEKYWRSVDLYFGGAEHATGHLLYSRFWQKFLKDLGWVGSEEPFERLINQGMILGTSALVHRVEGEDRLVSAGLKDSYTTTRLHVDVSLVENGLLDTEALRKWQPDLAQTEFILEDGVFKVEEEVEKMSKRWHNVINPDDVVAQYSADCLRMYEMFLGPLEQHKPWNTQGLSGVQGFLRKLWRLTVGDWSEDEPTKEEWKSLHKTIKKVTEDIEHFSFNTAVSSFMICVNELHSLKCTKRKVFEPLLIALSPFAPHITEELWQLHGNGFSVSQESWPEWDEKHLQESTVVYPISFNGKTRFTLELAKDLSKEEIEKAAMADERYAQYIQGKTVRKVIVVPGKIVNIVL